MAYVEALREKMSFPDLGSILDARTAPATVGVKTTVREAAKLMRERRTTAVCVMENDGKKIAGIFTSKDVVLRVIAAGLDAKTCSVVRVMTPHPDVGLPTLSIQDALRKMHGSSFALDFACDADGMSCRWTLSQSTGSGRLWFARRNRRRPQTDLRNSRTSTSLPRQTNPADLSHR